MYYPGMSFIFCCFESVTGRTHLHRRYRVKVDGRSARWRPRFGWMDRVKRALNDRRMVVREANERARNRNGW